MRKALSLICLIINCFIPMVSATKAYTDSTNIKTIDKVKNFFSLRDSDTIRSLSKITTAEDPLPVKKNNWGFQFSGFICNDIFWDNRKMADARDGAICLYPDNIKPDANGRDIHATASFNFVAMNTRLTLRIQSPDALGAKISGMIEGWFMGISNTNMNGFAMRHAFIKMEWKSTSLLLGQTWHPLFTEKCFAHTVAASAGAPFQPFSRAPQIRLQQRFAKTSNILLYMNVQRDNLSWGPNGPASEYLRQSYLPQAGIQYIFDYKGIRGEKHKNDIYIGLGADYKYLVPRLTTAGNIYTRKGLHCGTVLAFAHYAHHLSQKVTLGIKAKAILSQAPSEYLMVGGYAVKYYDNKPLNDSIDYTYTALNNFSSWIDLYARIRSWEVGMFAGYCKNLGSLNKVQDPQNNASYFARSPHIDYIYRVSARVKYNANKLQFALEPEYTAASYGNTKNEFGSILHPSDERPEVKTNLVHGIRILFSATLFF